MNLEINNLSKIITKVNEGSGIIFKSVKTSRCYIITAYHNIKTSIENNEDIKIFDDNNKPYHIIGEPYNDIKNDFSLLNIKFIEQDIPIIKFENNILPDDSITFMGYPDKANGKRKRLSGEIIEWNDKTAVNVMEKIQGSFVTKEKTQEVIVGFSGSGVFKKSEQELSLIGILKSLPEDDFDYKEISCIPIIKILDFIDAKIIVQNEIKLNSINILKNVILGKRDFKLLSNDEGIKNTKDGIHYEYFYYSDRHIKKAYIFLGNHVINKHVFSSIKKKIQKDKITSLEIFLAKVKSPSGTTINKIQHINKNINDYSLVRMVNDNIYYIDDFIWINTVENDLDNNITHTRKDFIDQIIYTENTEQIELSLNFLKKEIAHQDNPISIIYGSGGVGKTTLCNALEDTINNTPDLRKKVFYIKGEKIVDILSELNQSTFEIKSLNDLYILYKHENNFSDFDEEVFRLNYISGNIIVIIDAIEEIESALGDRFVLKSFLNSLSELNKSFFSTKIIITTREPFYNKIKDISIDTSIQYFQLLGFTNNDLDIFLKKRYINNDKNIDLVKSFIRENELFVNKKHGHIIPLFVDWTCKIIERPESTKSIKSKYFLKDIDIDKLLVKLINREIEKQSLSLDLDEMFQFLEEIIIVHNGIIPIDKFSEYILLAIGDKNIDNYIKNPLFTVAKKSIKIKYDILINFIKSRSLRYKLKNNQDTTKDLLAVCYDGKSELYNSVIKICNKKESLEYFVYQIKYLTDLMKLDNFKNSIEKENIKKCISAILYISSEVLIQNKENSEYTSLLQKLYNTVNISYLFIYGDFHPIDFRNLKIMDSEFNKYTTFQKCTFSDNSLFSYTIFQNFDINKSDSIYSKLFEQCQYLNSNIGEIIKEVDTKKNDKEEEIYKDIAAVCKKIGESQKLFKVFKNEKTIKTNIRINVFLNKLVEIELLTEKESKNGIMYRVNKDYYDELPDIKLCDFPPLLKENIDKIFFN